MQWLAWMAGTVAGSWLLPRGAQPWWLAACSALFLALHAPGALLAMAGITLLAGLAAIRLRARPALLPGAVLASLACLLGYRLLGKGSGEGVADLVLLGFAFQVLRVIHFLLDCYSGRIRQPGWRELIAWLWFLPTLQLGPIHRFAPFARDLGRRRPDAALFDGGLQRILVGYLKLVVAGNYLVELKLTQWIATLPPDGWAHHYFDTLRYGLSLYCRFAGYSDIAIGFALLMGFRIAENFDSPFLASDLVDFWRRWHMSLSSCCRDYVYLPVLSLTRRPALAALASMILLGVWHELSWRYLLWGLWHGAGIALCQRWQRLDAVRRLNGSRWRGLWQPCAFLITQHFVFAGFTLTALGGVEETLARWRILLGGLA